MHLMFGAKYNKIFKLNNIYIFSYRYSKTGLLAKMAKKNAPTPVRLQNLLQTKRI